MASIVCIGDSVTYGAGVTTTQAWPYLLGQTLGLSVTNKGVSGQVTATMAARFASDVVALHPTHAFIMGGANDVNASYSEATIEANLTSMYDAAIAAGIVPIRCTVTARNPAGAGGGTAFNTRLATLNTWIRAQTKGLLFDSYNALGAWTSPLFLDEVHPSVLGHQTLAAAAALVMPQAFTATPSGDHVALTFPALGGDGTIIERRVSG